MFLKAIQLQSRTGSSITPKIAYSSVVRALLWELEYRIWPQNASASLLEKSPSAEVGAMVWETGQEVRVAPICAEWLLHHFLWFSKVWLQFGSSGSSFWLAMPVLRVSLLQGCRWTERERVVIGRSLWYFMLAAQKISGCETHLFVLARNTYKTLDIISIPGSIQLSDTDMSHNHLLFTRPSWEGFRKKPQPIV